jgi:hypothetical protein
VYELRQVEGPAAATELTDSHLEGPDDDEPLESHSHPCIHSHQSYLQILKDLHQRVSESISFISRIFNSSDFMGKCEPLLARGHAALFCSLPHEVDPLHPQPRLMHRFFQNSFSSMTAMFSGLLHPLENCLAKLSEHRDFSYRC